MTTTEGGFLVVKDPGSDDARSRLVREVSEIRGKLGDEQQHRSNLIATLTDENKVRSARLEEIDAAIEKLRLERSDLVAAMETANSSISTLQAAAGDVGQLHRDLLGALYATTSVDAHCWATMVSAYDTWATETETAASSFDPVQLAQARAQVADADENPELVTDLPESLQAVMRSAIDAARDLVRAADATRSPRPGETAPIYVTSCENFAVVALPAEMEGTAAHVHVTVAAADVSLHHTTSGGAPFTWIAHGEGDRAACLVVVPAPGEGATAAIALQIELAESELLGLAPEEITDVDLSAALCAIASAELDGRTK